MSGTVIGLVGCLVVLADDTWSIRRFRLAGWALPSALVLAVACFAVRHAAWLEVSGGSFAWSLGFDAVPLIGDSLSLAFLVSSTLLVVSVVRPHRWVTVVLALGAAAILFVSLVSAAFTSIAARGTDAVLSMRTSTRQRLHSLLRPRAFWCCFTP